MKRYVLAIGFRSMEDLKAFALEVIPGGAAVFPSDSLDMENRVRPYVIRTAGETRLLEAVAVKEGVPA